VVPANHQFLRLLPLPEQLTVDIGCGDGRLTPRLRDLGYAVAGIDASPSLVAAARTIDPTMRILRAHAAALPLAHACAHLAIAFMSLHDIDAMRTAVGEAARILSPAAVSALRSYTPSIQPAALKPLPGTLPS
jgi:ubiquinone/menaquinone biosynthesis C-methylase UbiE